ncbi:hypothetical protein [Natronorarus salvus]|uniref:hypothetical protein n=1 Tax=Natronorarus salvus TaxID=3117733 RepID=UPI002F25F0E5
MSARRERSERLGMSERGTPRLARSASSTNGSPRNGERGIAGDAVRASNRASEPPACEQRESRVERPASVSERSERPGMDENGKWVTSR